MTYEEFMVLYPDACDAWINAIPYDVYAECPCGCGLKWRFVSKEANTIGEHEVRFYKKLLGITVFI